MTELTLKGTFRVEGRTWSTFRGINPDQCLLRVKLPSKPFPPWWEGQAGSKILGKDPWGILNLESWIRPKFSKIFKNFRKFRPDPRFKIQDAPGVFSQNLGSIRLKFFEKFQKFFLFQKFDKVGSKTPSKGFRPIFSQKKYF